MKVWITKYVLTQGILEADGEAATWNKDMCSIAPIKSNNSEFTTYFAGFFHKGEWFKTKEEAIQKAEEMRLRKIKSLENQLKKLTLMEFK
jgi:hypothetical protein